MDIMGGGLTPPADLIEKSNKTSINFGTIFIIALIVAFVIVIISIILECKQKTPKKQKNNKSQCPICGEQTEIYCGNPRQDKLCRVHAAMLRDNQIALCKYCGSWYKTDAGCKCQQLDQE